jgi:hypothetical protein
MVAAKKVIINKVEIIMYLLVSLNQIMKNTVNFQVATAQDHHLATKNDYLSFKYDLILIVVEFCKLSMDSLQERKLMI